MESVDREIDQEKISRLIANQCDLAKHINM